MDDQAERMYGLMRNESNRLKTFQMNPPWPKDYVDIKKLAKAGFFYAFNGDNVHCAFCRGQVCRWDRDDDPMSEHARHFTTCPFIMGGEVGNEPLGEDPFPGPKRPRPYDVCGMFPNFPPNDPRAQLYQNQNNEYRHHRHQQQLADHDQLPANQNQAEEININGNNDLSQYNYSNYVGGGNYHHHNQQQEQQLQTEFSNDLLINNDHQRTHIIDNNDQNNINNHQQPVLQPPNHGDSLTSENQQTRYNSPVGSNTSNCSSSTNSLTGICKVCYTNSIELLFLPCGHGVSCLSCAQRLHSCPFCRATITTRIRSYYV